MEKIKNKPTILFILSFSIPAVVILAALAGLGITPFGDNSLAISDGNALYINYMGYVGRAVQGQEGLLFSFEKGLGGNMMGSWAWFLLNPFFVLFAFADVTNFMLIYTWVSLLNFCVCGLTMYILLKDIYGHKGSNLIFSTAYALNGFLVANVFQLNFFSVIPVLPIMVMGLRRILKDQNPIVYIISVAYALLTNFYFGFMLCTASFLFFLVFFIADRKQRNNNKRIVLKYIVSSFLAGILSSIVWLPALLSLRGGRLDQSIANIISFKENMPFLDMFSKLFTGANSTAELSNGLPNIFVGILPVFLVILFFINKEISKQEKTVAAVLLISYLVSFYVVAFNIAMHGGTVTNWFNYRDSFVFCFLMLMVAAEEWQHITVESSKNMKRAAAILVISALIIFSKKYEYVSGTMALLDFSILALMLFAYWIHKKDPVKNTKRAFSMVVLVLMCLNLYLNFNFCTKNIMVWTNKESDYQKVTVPVGALVEGVKSSDNSFYRMEIGETRAETSGNDPMLYGYYGVGHSGSDDRDFVRTALSQLGVHRFEMRNYYGRGITSATDTVLGIKYIISKDDLLEEKRYERLLNLGEWGLYKNPYALPVSMLVDSHIDEVENDFEDVFVNLNSTWKAITGSQDSIFDEESNISFSSHNISDSMEISHEAAMNIVASRDASASAMSLGKNVGSVEAGNIPKFYNESDSLGSDSQNRGTFQEKPDRTNYIKYTFTASRDGSVYSYNRSGMIDNSGSYIPTMNYEGYYQKGDIVTGYLPVTDSVATEYLLEEVAGRFKVAYLDNDALVKMSQIILSRPSTIEKITDTHLTGTFTAKAGLELMFTIPYDEGWTLTIDGKKTELKKVLDVFMGADVEPGEHTYEMKFMPSGFRIGAMAAGVSLLLIIIYVLLDSRRRRKFEVVSFVQKGLTDAINDSDTDKSNENMNQTIAHVVDNKEKNAVWEPNEP